MPEPRTEEGQRNCPDVYVIEIVYTCILDFKIGNMYIICPRYVTQRYCLKMFQGTLVFEVVRKVSILVGAGVGGGFSESFTLSLVGGGIAVFRQCMVSGSTCYQAIYMTCYRS